MNELFRTMERSHVILKIMEMKEEMKGGMVMPANVGEMFYYGEIPWHREGTELDLPANSEEAIEFGGLDWEVETVGLRTDEEPSSRVETRFAIVRKDRPKGHSERVVGVAHKDFKPLQNREGEKVQLLNENRFCSLRTGLWGKV